MPTLRLLRRLGLLCLLLLSFSAGTSSAETSGGRIVAIGDVHGDFEQFTLLLKDAGLVDDRLRWSGGTSILVQMGDVPDRGPDSLKVIQLLQKLQKDARRAGGGVHCLIGNHEAMNMTGDLRYVHPGEFAAFVSRDSKRIQEAHFEDSVAWVKQNLPQEQWPVFDDAYKAAWFNKYPLGYVELVRAWNVQGKIGSWVLENPALLRLGDTLFVHGGLGPSYATKTLEQINGEIRAALEDTSGKKQAILRDQEGPLWYRGLATHTEVQERPHLDRLLTRFQVRRIVIGHTPTMGFVLPRFEGRVVQLDVGLGRHYGSGRACLVLDKDKAYTLHHGQLLELPEAGPETTLAYLKRAASTGPSSPALLQLIQQMEHRLMVETPTAPGNEPFPQTMDTP